MTDKKELAEAAKNCAACKKQISRAKRYYRDGAYYCNKNCYQKKMADLAQKAAEEKAEAEAAAKQAAEAAAAEAAQKETAAAETPANE